MHPLYHFTQTKTNENQEKPHCFDLKLGFNVNTEVGSVYTNVLKDNFTKNDWIQRKLLINISISFISKEMYSCCLQNVFL